jgi:hypothetical protein
MTYVDHWKRISAWTLGVREAGHGPAGTMDSARSRRDLDLRKQVYKIFLEIVNFAEQFAQQIPPDAKAALQEFTTCQKQWFEADKNLDRAQDALFAEDARAKLILLSALIAQVSYLMADQQKEVKSITDRAFLHLQRTITVDQTTREKWKTAFARGETACEALGATHLLGHGIWAFKADAAKGATDLVYEEPMPNFAADFSSAVGLVLTEWKKLSKPDQEEASWEAARKQLKNYSAGVLGGTQLRAFRYAVVVSQHGIQVPQDSLQDGITYRHINIAVDPKIPSKA